MICPKCGKPSIQGAIYCSECNAFLNINKIKELFSEAKNNIKQKNFYDAAIILINCMKLTKDTKYERQFKINLKLVKGKLKTHPEQVKTKINEIINYEKNKQINKALVLWKEVLELSILPDKTNKKIKKRIEVLNNTIYPEPDKIKSSKTILNPDNIKEKFGQIFLFKYITPVFIILISSILIYYLFSSKNTGNTSTTIIDEVLPKSIVKLKSQNKYIKDLIFVKYIKGTGIYYKTNSELSRVNEYTIIGDYPVNFKISEGLLEIKFNNNSTTIRIFDNSNIKIDYDTDLILTLNLGKFYINTNEHRLLVRTNFSEILLTENTYLINILNDRDELVIGNYHSKDAHIINRNFSKYKRHFQPGSMIIVKSDNIPDIPIKINKTKFYKELIFWKYNM